MLKSITLTAAALATAAAALAPGAAVAQRYRHDYHHSYDRGTRYHYRDPRHPGRGDPRCNNLGGTVIGAIAGGLLGRTIDTRGDRTVGTLGGALAGGLAGREIARSDNPRHCRVRR